MNEDRLEELPVECRAEVKHVRADVDRLRLARQNMAADSEEGESDSAEE